MAYIVISVAIFAFHVTFSVILIENYLNQSLVKDDRIL